MQNFIPLDFFEANKNTVYTNKVACIKHEGSAIGFNPRTIDLSVSIIQGENVVVDETKVAAKEALKNSVKYKADRRADYEAQGLTFDSFVEMLIEDDVAGIADYRSKRAAIKVKHKKPAL